MIESTIHHPCMKCVSLGEQCSTTKPLGIWAWMQSLFFFSASNSRAKISFTNLEVSNQRVNLETEHWEEPHRMPSFRQIECWTMSADEVKNLILGMKKVVIGCAWTFAPFLIKLYVQVEVDWISITMPYWFQRGHLRHDSTPPPSFSSSSFIS